MTIAQIRQKIADDSFQYNSVRVVAKVKTMSPQTYKLVAEDPNDTNQSITIDYYLLKQKQIERGKIYEFLGEVEQTNKSITTETAVNQGQQTN